MTADDLCPHPAPSRWPGASSFRGGDVPARKVCNVFGCIATATQRGKCDQHAREADRARGTRQERGYGREHDDLRRAWLLRGVVGQTCPTCLQLILPGQAWDLGHTADRLGYIGPQHAGPCNRAEGGRAAHDPSRRRTPGG